MPKRQNEKLRQYTSKCQSPLGEILLAADDAGLTGLWFDHEKYYALSLAPDHEEKEIPASWRPKNGLMSTFRGANRISRQSCTC
jgi:methylated-DNA-[protein]-cysteine S-methyltransferase